MRYSEKKRTAADIGSSLVSEGSAKPQQQDTRGYVRHFAGPGDGPRRVVATLLPVADEVPSRPATGVRVVQCRSQQMMAEMIGLADVVIVDPRLAWRWLHAESSRALLRGKPVILRSELNAPVARLLLELTAWLPDCVVSVRGFDDLASDLTRVLEYNEAANPALLLVNAAGPFPSEVIQVLVIGAAVLGRRRTNLPEFARRCALSTRTIEYSLSRTSLPHASKLLGWSLALHTCWRHEVLGWSLGRCAVAAGFSESGPLSAFVKRHVQLRPHKLLEAGGFTVLLRRWGRLVEPRSTGPPTAPAVASPSPPVSGC